jgi:FKBP-type peptidyl-prolyl cis-trans isomerase (trigger factor)
MMQRQFVQLLQSGVPREKIEENLATLQSAAEEQARRDLKLSFILGKLAEEKGIEVTEMEINSRIAQMASQYGRRPERMRQELASDGSLQTLAASIQEEKVLDSLLENAKVVDVAPADADAKAEKKSEKKATKKAAKKADKDETEDDKSAESKATKKSTKKAAKKSSKKSSKDNAAKDDEE